MRSIAIRSEVAALLCAMAILAGCASTPSSTTSGRSPMADRVLTVATSLVGTPYCSAGTTPECFDCSGFVTHCFAGTGIALPRRASDMYASGTAVGKGALRPGDLVFFRTSGRDIAHVGIMINASQFVHASTSKGVMVSPLSDAYWSPRYVGARRVVIDR